MSWGIGRARRALHRGPPFLPLGRPRGLNNHQSTPSPLGEASGPLFVFLCFCWGGMFPHPPIPLARLSFQLKSFGSSSKHAEIGSESFGIVVCRFLCPVPDVLRLVWASFRLNSGSKSKIPGRIPKRVRGAFDSAECWPDLSTVPALWHARVVPGTGVRQEHHPPRLEARLLDATEVLTRVLEICNHGPGRSQKSLILEV